jgi:hypothetical protein
MRGVQTSHRCLLFALLVTTISVGSHRLSDSRTTTITGTRGHHAHAAIPVHKQPLLTYVDTVASDPDGNLRDPSPVIQDPVTGRYHFWVDWLPGATMPGWDAYLRHYSAPNITGPWVNHGLALNHSSDPAAWDYAGQFSSSAFFDAEDGTDHGTWWLYYSASGANQSAMLTNAQIVCSSTSPDGPWTRRGLAAWPTGSPATQWTTSVAATPNCVAGHGVCWNARFVDSGRALVVGGRRSFWTKGVEGGTLGALVASYGVYLPESNRSFAPPYTETGGNPVYAPLGKPGEGAGYENCEFFTGADDGLFHILCTWDGGTLGPPGLPQGVHPHFVVDLATDPLGEHWIYTGSIAVYNTSDPAVGKTVPMAGEPTPVYEGGPPGDTAKVGYFIAREDGITHGGPGALRIGLFKLTWVDPVPSPPPAPPPPPPSPPPGPPAPPRPGFVCPAGWTTHVGGFWDNTDPCPHNHWSNCTADTLNGTVAACARKCVLTPGCVAFDTCVSPGPCGCYIFVGGLVEPFTPNPKDLTCLRRPQ